MINHPMMGALLKDIEIVFFDTETSGCVPLGDQVIQLSAVKISPINGGTHSTFSEYIKLDHGRSIHPEALAVHGITEGFLEEHGIPAEESFSAFQKFVGPSALLVAHQASFDTSMCAEHSMQNHTPYVGLSLWDAGVLDTHFFSRITHLDTPGYKMDDLLLHFGLPGREADQHDALEDCILGAKLTLVLLEPFLNMPLSLLTSRFPEVFVHASGQGRGKNYNLLWLRKRVERIIEEQLEAHILYCKKGQNGVKQWRTYPLELDIQNDGQQYLKVSQTRDPQNAFTLRLERIFDIQPVTMPLTVAT